MIKAKPRQKRRVQAGPVVAGALKSFVERIERVETEQKATADSKREIYDEAKGHGYDAKTIRWVVQERKMEAGDRAERDSLRAVYGHALSLAIEAVSNGDMSLRQAAAAHGVSKSSIHRALAVPEVSREMVAEDLGDMLPPHDPATGEIIKAATKPATPFILPSPSAWASITAVREAHHAAIEAAREARRLEREQDRRRLSALAALTDADMPEPPPFLIRAKQERAA